MSQQNGKNISAFGESESPYQGPERRKHKRYLFRNLFCYCPAGKSDFLSASIINIGIGGLLFSSPQKLEFDQRLEIRIPFEEDKPSPALELKAKIVWCGESKDSGEEGEEGYPVGIHFVDVPTGKHILLKKLIEKEGRIGPS